MMEKYDILRKKGEMLKMEERKQIESMFFSCLRSAVTGEPLEKSYCRLLNDERQKAVYHLAKKHDVAHLVAHVWQKENLPLTAQAKQVLHRVRMTAVYRSQLLIHEQKQISRILEDACIPHAFLKGAVLRGYYPEPWMRTSCDIDLLVHFDDLKTASELLTEKLDYRSESVNDHDIQMFAPNDTHVELHYTLCVNHPLHDELLKHAWDYTFPSEDKTAAVEFEFSFHLCYILAHMAKHVLIGGCGVRPLLDLFIVRSDRRFDEQRLLLFCERAGLLPFYRACCSLCDVWFLSQTPTEDDLVFSDFILGAGVYGNTENYVTVSRVRKGGRFMFLLSRLFPPKTSIYALYPGAERYAVLLPLYYFRRFFRLLLPERRKASVMQWRYAQSTTKKDAEKIGELLSRLGL